MIDASPEIATLTVRYELGLSDFRRFARFCWLRGILKGRVGNLVINLLLAIDAYANLHWVPWLAFPVSWQGAVVPITVLAFRLFVGASSMWATDKSSRASAKASSLQEVSIDRDCVRVESVNSSRHIPWGSILSIERDGELFYVFTGSAQAILIKRSAFGSVAREDQFFELAITLRAKYRFSGSPYSNAPTPSYEFDNRIVFQLSQADLKHLLDFQRKQTGAQAQRYFQAVLWSVVGCLALIASEMPADLLYSDWVWLSFCVAFPVATMGVNSFVSSSDSSARKLIKFYPYAAPQVVELDSDGITVTKSTGKTVTKWAGVENIGSTANGIYIVLTKYNIVGIPSSAFLSVREQENFFGKMNACRRREFRPDSILDNGVESGVWPPMQR